MNTFRVSNSWDSDQHFVKPADETSSRQNVNKAQYKNISKVRFKRPSSHSGLTNGLIIVYEARNFLSH